LFRQRSALQAKPGGDGFYRMAGCRRAAWGVEGVVQRRFAVALPIGACQSCQWGAQTASAGAQNGAPALSWRGDFGVARKKAGRFLGRISRQEAGWRVEGVGLVDAVP
jgi:hypothetical protein